MSFAATAMLGMSALFLASFGGCGFAVDDWTEHAHAGSVAVTSDDARLRGDLESFLGRQGLAVSDDAALRVTVNGTESEDIVSLTEIGTVNKYRLVYRITFGISRNGENVNNGSFSVREVVTHNESSHLAKREERRSLFDAMRRTALDRIWFHIQREIGKQ